MTRYPSYKKFLEAKENVISEIVRDMCAVGVMPPAKSEARRKVTDLILEADDKDDIIPEGVPSRSKLGDLYELGNHRVLCGDSTQQEAVLRLMDGKKADMVFTDPPYGVNFEYDEYKPPK